MRLRKTLVALCAAFLPLTACTSTHSNSATSAHADAKESVSPSPTPSPTPKDDFLQVAGTPKTVKGPNGIRWVEGVDCAQTACVAITFDDGPGDYEDQIFDILERTNTPATYFYLGRMITANPTPIQRAKQLGMDFGGHSWSHPQLTKLNAANLRQQVADVNQLLTQNIGFQPKWFRPPYGAQNATVLQELANHGLTSILWDIDTEDWKNKSVEETTRRALEAEPGSIVLVHSIHPSTRDSTEGIINGLRAKGYTLVSVEQLLQGTNVQPGQTVFARNHMR